MKKNIQTIRTVQFVTVVGMALNLILVFAKAAGGWFFYSQALFADAVHSLSDLVTDLAVIFGVKYWSAPPDRLHPYGHGRIETLVSAFIGLALAGVAIGLARDAIDTLRHGAERGPAEFAFVIAAFSIVTKEWLFHWTLAKARAVRSPAMMANAWHHRSDAISSIPAAVAIAIAYFFPNLHFVDALGAILVSGFILYSAWTIVRPTLQELSETGVSPEDQEKIYRLAASLPGIIGAHALRTRNTGGAIWADIHITVDPDMTVREGHDLSHQVRDLLVNSDLNIVDVVVHLEPPSPSRSRSASSKNSDQPDLPFRF
ncbi:MAG: cation transporter [Lentisphaeria bacterium]|nr:cation transporter [Lentisphaeria bacterium]